MTHLAWATFAWQSDYGQFYLVDAQSHDLDPPVDITDETAERSFFVPPTGLVVYTADCLQQHIRIVILDAEPEPSPSETISDRPWTRIRTADVHFPSASFTIAGPTVVQPSLHGPLFLLPTTDARARISWVEDDSGRGDTMPIEPDVIEIALWPR